MAQATNDTSARTRKPRPSATVPKPNGAARSTAVVATPRPRTRGKEATIVVPAPVTALAPSERSLAELEAVIEKHKLAFIEVGQALLEIRERKLYRDQGFQTFQEYCEQRWDFGRKRGYQLAEAAKLASEVDVRGLPERAVRELAPLRHEPAQAQAAVNEATATARAQGRQRPTADDVKKSVARRRPTTKPGGRQSPRSAAQAALKARIEARKGEQALEQDRYLDAALRSYEIVAEQLEAIDTDKLRGALAELDPLHAHVTRAADIARRIAVWGVRAGMTVDKPDAAPAEQEPAPDTEPGADATTGSEASE